MGMATRLYGCIVEYGLLNGECEKKIHDHNEKKINELMDNNDWPPLSKNMFSITPKYVQNLNNIDFGYSGRIIHFGGNFKSVEYDWNEWQEKFENLLTQLLWVEADVHIKTEYSSILSNRWVVDPKKWSLSEADLFKPIKKEYWVVKGDIYF